MSLMVLTLILAVVDRRAAGRARGLEGRAPGSTASSMAFAVLRLLGAGLRRRLSARLHLRAAARLGAGAGLHAARRKGVWPWFKNLILPSITLGFVYIALIARITRASMLEVLQQDYIRTARAKGVGAEQPSCSCMR